MASTTRGIVTAKLATLLYGVLNYVLFLAVFLYLICFLGNFIVPRTIDSEAAFTLDPAWLVNVGLLVIFGIQHTVMARPTFKNAWTKIVPKPVERSTYMLLTNVLLILLFWAWQPMTGVVWDIQNPIGSGVLWAVFAAGWLVVLVSTFLINHFDLFGLRHVWLFFTGTEYTHLTFGQPLFYRHIRHPLYLGWMMAFWVTPSMTTGHLLFAIGTTVYMLIAIVYEERNLIQFHGEAYAEYRRRTPMLIPRPWRWGPAGDTAPSSAATPESQ